MRITATFAARPRHCLHFQEPDREPAGCRRYEKHGMEPARCPSRLPRGSGQVGASPSGRFAALRINRRYERAEERFFARGALRMTRLGAALSTTCATTAAWKAALRNKIGIAVAFALLGFVTSGGAQTVPTVGRRINAPVDDTIRTTLAGNTHPLARPEFDQGAAPPELPMSRMLLVLKRSAEQETALQQLMDQQHDKSSPNYHRWLTPDQLGQQFGPADQDIQAVTSWLQSHGFQVARVGWGRTAIEFSGTAAQVRDAFRTEIHSYLVGGAQHWANTTDPQIPAALTPVVSGIASLNNFPVRPLLHVAGAFSKSVGTGKVAALGSRVSANGVPLASAGPQFTFTDSTCQPECYALGPSDFATIYNVLPLWNSNPAIDGTGQSIAIVGESNINLQDVRDFRSMFGLPPNDPQVIVDGPDPGLTQNDVETEALLDVEWSARLPPKPQSR
jgi:Pro-kumamolisin, activation domain